MKQFKKLLALLLVLCVAGLPVFAMAMAEEGDGGSAAEVVESPKEEPKPEPPKEEPKPAPEPPKEPEPEPQPEPEPVEPPKEENPVPPTTETNPETPPTTETSPETPPTTNTDPNNPPTTEGDPNTPPTTETSPETPPTTDVNPETPPATEATEVPAGEIPTEVPEATEDPAMLIAIDELLMNTPIDGIEVSADGTTLTVVKPNNAKDVPVSSIQTKLKEATSVTQIVVANEGIISGSGEIALPVTVAAGGQINGGTYKAKVTNQAGGKIAEGTFEGEVENSGTVSGGMYSGTVTNKNAANSETDKGITGGTFNGTVTNSGTISSGKYTGKVTNQTGAKITEGTFEGEVENSGTISGGKYTGKVTNQAGGVISEGTFETHNDALQNSGTISGGTFNRAVTNGNDKSSETDKGITGGTFNNTVTNSGTISGGTFDGEVTNSGKIEKGEANGGTFNQKVTNQANAEISDGKFFWVINEEKATISGGTFTYKTTILEDGTEEKQNAHVENAGTISGGTFETESYVENTGTISGETATFAGTVTNGNGGEIAGGQFTGSVENTGTISGETATFAGTVTNKNGGEITGGKFTGNAEGDTVDVTNEGTISNGVFSGVVSNTGSITAGTFESGSKIYSFTSLRGIVTDGDIVVSSSSISMENCTVGGSINAVNQTGVAFDDCTISGNLHAGNGNTVTNCTVDGTFSTEKNTTATGCTLNGKISVGKGSKITGATFGGKASVSGNEGTIQVRFKYKLSSAGTEREGTANYGDSILTALKKLQQPSTGYAWCKGNSTSKKVGNGDKFGLNNSTVYTLLYVGTGSTSSGSGSSSGSGTGWTDPATSSWGDVEEEENLVLGPEQSLADDFLEDGGSVKLDIMHGSNGTGADYELIPIPATSPEPTATDGTLAANGTAAADDGGELDLGALTAETEAETEIEAVEDVELTGEEGEEIEEIERIPGEADEEGNVPGMLYVRAKGLGTEERRMTLTFSQLERMHREQGVDVLLFRNGSATVSMNVDQLFEGNVAKLMELMHAWEYNGANFDDYDLSIIDFDAIQIAPVFTDAELREFKLEMVIAPAVPVGYTVQVNLCLGENSKEISLLLEDMGVTMHAQTVTDNVAVYYMNNEQERFLLETHEGVVPGVDTEIEGYEVLFDSGAATVLDLSRSVTDTEFAGLCASTGDTGTYYIGVLPSAQASATPAANAEATLEPSEEPTPEPSEEPEDPTMELVVDVPI